MPIKSNTDKSHGVNCFIHYSTYVLAVSRQKHLQDDPGDTWWRTASLASTVITAFPGNILLAANFSQNLSKDYLKNKTTWRGSFLHSI